MADRNAAAALLQRFEGDIEAAARALASEVEAGPRVMKEETHFTEIKTKPEQEHRTVLYKDFYKFYEDGDPVTVYYYVDGRITENSWTYHLNSDGDTLTLRLPKGTKNVHYYVGKMQVEINRIQGSNNSVYQYFLERNVVLPTQITYCVRVKPGKLSDWQIDELESKKTAVFNFWVKGETAKVRVMRFFSGFNLSEKDAERQNFFDDYFERLYEKLDKLNDIADFAAGAPYELADVDLTEARRQRKIHAEIIDSRRLLHEKKTELKGPSYDEEYEQDFYEIHVSHSDTMALLFWETENASADLCRFLEERYEIPFSHFYTVVLDVPLTNEILQKTGMQWLIRRGANVTFEFNMRSEKKARELTRKLKGGKTDDVVKQLQILFEEEGRKKGWSYDFEDQFFPNGDDDTDPYPLFPRLKKTKGFAPVDNKVFFETLTQKLEGDEENEVSPIGFRIVVGHNIALRMMNVISMRLGYDDRDREFIELDASAKPAPKNQVDKFNSKKAIPVAIPKKVVIPVPAKIPVISKKDKRTWRF
jgi:hypothetical protein